MTKIFLWVVATLITLFTSSANATTYTAYCQGQVVVASSLAVFGPNCKNITVVGSNSSPSPGKSTPVVTPVVSTNPSCPAGWTPSGATCYSPANWGAKCPSGSTLNGGMCSGSTTTTRVSASCPNGMGMNLNDGICRTYNMKTRTFGSPQAQANCPAGTTKSGSSCIKSTSTGSSKASIVCSIGTSEGPYCKTPPSCTAGLRNVGGRCVR